MNKEDFNILDIQQQVDYINNQLELDSLTKVCASIGIDRATVRKRFKSKGFELVDNKYTHTGDNTIEAGATREVKAPTKKTSSQQKGNKSSDIKILEDKINSLEAQIKGIMDIINTKELPKTTNDIKVYEGSTVTRSYKINEDIQQQFKLFCKKNNNHTISDIISSALDAFIKNNS